MRLPDGSDACITEGTRITDITVIAGKGRKRGIDEVDILVEEYPGTEKESWQKLKGKGYVDFQGESYAAELHWYEEPNVGRVKWKIKPDASGNWFYDEN